MDISGHLICNYWDGKVPTTSIYLANHLSFLLSHKRFLSVYPSLFTSIYISTRLSSQPLQWISGELIDRPLLVSLVSTKIIYIYFILFYHMTEMNYINLFRCSIACLSTHIRGFFFFFRKVSNHLLLTGEKLTADNVDLIPFAVVLFEIFTLTQIGLSVGRKIYRWYPLG